MVSLPSEGAGRSDPGTLLESLAAGLPESAGAALEVERRRSVGDRLAGRPGRVVSVTLQGPQLRLTLRSDDGRRAVAESAREVRGVVISRQVLPVAGWLDLLAAELRALAAASATTDVAVTRTLAALGVREPASDLSIDPADVPGGLRLLPDRLAGRVPPDVLETVRRLCAALLDTLPRLDGSLERSHAVLRTATDYLPRTLQAYAALPPEWASTHPMAAGGTALDALREQLSVLDGAVARMRDAALSSDADALAANGYFLADRFGTSALDHPTP